MKKFLRLFLPHPKTHQKAHLLSWHFLVIYILLFILLEVSFDIISQLKPGVLGTNSTITVEQIIADTNKHREIAGLSPLLQNSALSQAAYTKAQNMFEENYWAHFSPSGKDPWKFIQGSGYKFSYAGENLAKNFYNSGDVVTAWMNSPSHKENITSSNYQDIGVAVVEGVLQGQKTTLVVQMFGTPYQAIAAAPKIDLGGTKVDVPILSATEHTLIPIAGTSTQNTTLTLSKPLIDPFQTTKAVSIVLIIMIALLLMIDFVVLKRRQVFRFSSHHFAHLSLLAVAGSTLLFSKIGEIL